MLKRIAQAIVSKNRLDKFNHALKFTDCDSELVQEEIKKFEEARPKTTFVVKQYEKYLKNQDRENETQH